MDRRHDCQFFWRVNFFTKILTKKLNSGKLRCLLEFRVSFFNALNGNDRSLIVYDQSFLLSSSLLSRTKEMALVRLWPIITRLPTIGRSMPMLNRTLIATWNYSLVIFKLITNQSQSFRNQMLSMTPVQTTESVPPKKIISRWVAPIRSLKMELCRP